MDDIQSISKRQSDKASRSLTPVPEKLGKLLKLVNIVPPDAVLPDITEKLNAAPHMQESRLLDELDQILKTLPGLVVVYVWFGEEKLLGILDGTPDVVRDMLDVFERLEKDGADDDEMELSEEAWQQHLNLGGYLAGIRYTYLRESREMLRDIARHAKSHSLYLGQLPKTRLSLSHGSIIICNTGHLKYTPPPFVKAIEGVEATRIRECEVCNLLFWAGRLDQKTCTTKCAKVLRTRRWRDKYQTNYKLQRNGYEPFATDREDKATRRAKHNKKLGVKKGK